MNYKLLGFFGIMSIAAVVVLAFLNYPLFKQHNRSLTPVVIATLKAPHSGLVQIADSKGFFSEEGLAVTIRTTLTGHESIDLVLSGEADFGGSAETPIAKGLAEGKRIKVITTIFRSSENVGIVIRKDRGIVRPSDLKGKRIGVVPGTATHYMLETFLAFNRIPVDSVTIVPTNPNEIVSAMVSGHLDAAATWNPLMAIMRQQLGENGQTFLPIEFYAETFNLVIRPDYLHQNRETVEKLIRSLLKAESYVGSHLKEAIRIIADVSELDPDFLGASSDAKTFRATLRQSVLLATENEVHWYFRRGLVPEAVFPDVLGTFEVEPLRAAKPLAVSIVQVK